MILSVNAKVKKPKNPADIPTSVLIPAFVISELKTAFIIGFVLYVPFLVIDMVVAGDFLNLCLLKVWLEALSDIFHLIGEVQDEGAVLAAHCYVQTRQGLDCFQPRKRFVHEHRVE